MKRIDILGIPYEIRHKKEYDWDKDGAMGKADSVKAIITLNSAMPQITENECLLHEITHLISESLSLDLTEAQVSGISIGIFSTLRKNKRLGDYLIGKKDVDIYTCYTADRKWIEMDDIP